MNPSDRNEVNPIDTGYANATLAQQYEDSHDLEKAIHFHFLAAENFLSATNITSDLQIIKTLKSQSVHHANRGRQLSRQLNIQNSINQQSTIKPPSPKPPLHLQFQTKHLLPMDRIPSSEVNMGSRQYFLGQSQSESINSAFIKPFMDQKSDLNGPALMAVTNLDDSRQSITPSPSFQLPMHHSLDKSYFLLESNLQDIPNDHVIPDDPFVKFWDQVEALVEKFTSPQPLQTSIPTFTYDESVIKHDKSANNIAIGQSYYFVNKERPSFEEENHDINLKYSKTFEELELENVKQREAIDFLTKRVISLEKTVDENNVLKNSICQFREDLAKQQKIQSSKPASKLMTVSDYMLQDKATLARKICEIEAQWHACQREIEKQAIILNKYKEKWDKLKEASKKKRDVQSSVILENPSIESLENEDDRNSESEITGNSVLYYSATL